MILCLIHCNHSESFHEYVENVGILWISTKLDGVGIFLDPSLEPTVPNQENESLCRTHVHLVHPFF